MVVDVLVRVLAACGMFDTSNPLVIDDDGSGLSDLAGDCDVSDVGCTGY